MLPTGKRSFNLLWLCFHRPPSLSRRLLHQPKPINHVKVLLSEDPDCHGFLPWIQKKAGVQVSSVLSIGKSNHGRALFASTLIQGGDCVLRVPYSAQLSPDNILPEVKALLGNDVENIAKLALVILAEQKKGQDSEWAPYIGGLPRPGEIHSTIFWDEDELKMIKSSFVYHATINQKSQIMQEYLVVKPVLDRFSAFFQDCTVEGFTHAYALDFLNHDGTSESVVLSDDLNQISEVIADRNYDPGEEVLIRYGKFPNSTLLMDFGFTLSYNIHDQVRIQMDIPNHDHLRTMKLEILHRHHFPAIKDAFFNSSGNSFLIKELKSTKGKGKGIPQSLRAFARISSCTSPQELDELVKEASRSDGRLARHPFKNANREIHAHQILLSRFEDLIEEYNASIRSLRLSKFIHIDDDDKHSVRRQIALDLLTGEVRVLRSASEWLKNCCIMYKEQT